VTERPLDILNVRYVGMPARSAKPKIVASHCTEEKDNAWPTLQSMMKIPDSSSEASCRWPMECRYERGILDIRGEKENLQDSKWVIRYK